MFKGGVGIDGSYEHRGSYEQRGKTRLGAVQSYEHSYEQWSSENGKYRFLERVRIVHNFR